MLNLTLSVIIRVLIYIFYKKEINSTSVELYFYKKEVNSTSLELYFL